MTHYEIHHVDNFKGDITFKGVPYGDFDRTGHWSLCNICRMFEASRMMMLNRNLFFYKDLVSKEAAFYVVKQNINLKPEVHRNTTLFSPSLLRFHLEISNVGNTSLTCVTQLFNEKSRMLMGEVSITFVYVNRKSGRPLKFPDWAQEQFEPYKNKSPIVNQKIPPCPESSYKATMDVRYSDSDVNGHLNQANYLQFCLDCATDAAKAGFYKYYTDDICWFPVVDIDVVYKGESLPGYEIDIFTWQDNTNKDIIYFIVKKGNKNIYEARFTLHDKKSPTERNSKL